MQTPNEKQHNNKKQCPLADTKQQFEQQQQKAIANRATNNINVPRETNKQLTASNNKSNNNTKAHSLRTTCVAKANCAVH